MVFKAFKHQTATKSCQKNRSFQENEQRRTDTENTSDLGWKEAPDPPAVAAVVEEKGFAPPPGDEEHKLTIIII